MLITPVLDKTSTKGGTVYIKFSRLKSFVVKLLGNAAKGIASCMHGLSCIDRSVCLEYLGDVLNLYSRVHLDIEYWDVTCRYGMNLRKEQRRLTGSNIILRKYMLISPSIGNKIIGISNMGKELETRVVSLDLF